MYNYVMSMSKTPASALVIIKMLQCSKPHYIDQKIYVKYEREKKNILERDRD